MSHSQFHCTGRAYLDMHGLIFETSICYWQDQPGRSAGESGRESTGGRPSVSPTRAGRAGARKPGGARGAGRARGGGGGAGEARRGEARRGAAGAGRAGDRGRAPDTHPATDARARAANPAAPRARPPGPTGPAPHAARRTRPGPPPTARGVATGGGVEERGAARGGDTPMAGAGAGCGAPGRRIESRRRPARARAQRPRGGGGPGPEAPEPPLPGAPPARRGGGRRLTTAGRDPSRRSGAPFRTRAAQRGDRPQRPHATTPHRRGAGGHGSGAAAGPGEAMRDRGARVPDKRVGEAGRRAEKA